MTIILSSLLSFLKGDQRIYIIMGMNVRVYKKFRVDFCHYM